jgi:Zn-dependent alcohol dehydrogenase
VKSKAAIQVEYGGPLVVEEIDIPDPGPNQVTVRNFASGVCYSQVHQLRNPAMPRPMGLGHEGSGVVTRGERSHPRKRRRSRHLYMGSPDSR